MPRLAQRAGSAALVLIALITGAESVQALPRYSAQYGQNCTLCHVNPTGGGMRGDYASQHLVPMEIAAQGWDEEELATLSPRLSPNISVGADLRSLLYQQEGGRGSSFAMQGDLYVNLEMSQKVGAYIEQGLNGSGEVFGTARFDPLDGYLKAGRFIPDYGWRFADHQMFNRRYLTDQAGSDSPAGLYGQGFEVGVSPGNLSASAALLGGQGQNGDNYSGRFLYQSSWGDLGFGIGASLLRRQLGPDSRRAGGGFYYVSVGPGTWLGEIDETKQNGQFGLMVTQELAWRVIQGYDLRATYNFHDPDRDLLSGVRRRYGAGVSAMPRPYLGYSLMANYWDIDSGPAVPETDRVEGELMIHFFY
jgi:hypothetical protein